MYYVVVMHLVTDFAFNAFAWKLIFFSKKCCYFQQLQRRLQCSRWQTPPLNRFSLNRRPIHVVHVCAPVHWTPARCNRRPIWYVCDWALVAFKLPVLRSTMGAVICLFCVCVLLIDHANRAHIAETAHRRRRSVTEVIGQRMPNKVTARPVGSPSKLPLGRLLICEWMCVLFLFCGMRGQFLITYIVCVRIWHCDAQAVRETNSLSTKG